MGPLGESRPKACSPLQAEVGAENRLSQGSRAAQGSESCTDHTNPAQEGWAEAAFSDQSPERRSIVSSSCFTSKTDLTYNIWQIGETSVPTAFRTAEQPVLLLHIVTHLPRTLQKRQRLKLQPPRNRQRCSVRGWEVKRGAPQHRKPVTGPQMGARRPRHPHGRCPLAFLNAPRAQIATQANNKSHRTLFFQVLQNRPGQATTEQLHERRALGNSRCDSTGSGAPAALLQAGREGGRAMPPPRARESPIPPPPLRQPAPAGALGAGRRRRASPRLDRRALPASGEEGEGRGLPRAGIPSAAVRAAAAGSGEAGGGGDPRQPPLGLTSSGMAGSPPPLPA